MTIEYQVLVKAAPGPGGLALQRRRLRALEPDDALVRIHRAAICGTDLHIVQWNAWAARAYRPPIAMGHELSGELVEVGADVRGLAVGDKVAVETHLECGQCAQCHAGRGHTCLNLRVFSRLDRGAFGEYSIVPARMLRLLPRALPHRHACLMEPLGIAARAVAESRATTSLLVIGCGPIGLMAIAAAKALGVRRVVASDLAEYRLQLALAVGADTAIDASSPASEPALQGSAPVGGFDGAVETSGSARGIAMGLAAARPGGVLSLVGLPAEPVSLDVSRHVVLREVEIRGVYGRRLVETWESCARLMPTLGPALDRITTHEFDLGDFEQAFAVATSGASGKVQFRIAD